MGHSVKVHDSVATMKILVVDDQPEVLALIQSMLEPLGCEVLTLTSGPEAAEKVQAESFDSVFVDVQMPEMDGYALATLVRSSLKNGKVPIVMLTDEDNIQTMRRAFKAGATCFLGKPITKDRVQSLYNVVLGPMLAQRRKQARVPFHALVNCSIGTSGGRQFATWSQNVGESGMTLELTESVEVGQALNLEFTLFRGSPSLRLMAKVIRLTPPNCLDVEFLNPSILDLERIQEFALNPPSTDHSETIRPPGTEIVQAHPDEGESLREIFEAIKRGPKPLAKPPTQRLKSAAYFAAMLVVGYITYSVVTRLTTSASETRAPASRSASAVRSSSSGNPAGPPSTSVPAVNAPSITVTPGVILAPYDPGQPFSADVKLNNLSGQELNFSVVAEDMVIQQGRLVAVPAGQAPNGVAANVNFSSRVVNVKPWRTAIVNVSMTLPDETAVRGVLILLNGTEKIPALAGITLQPSLGTLITFVEPNIKGQKPSSMNYPVSQWHAN